MKDKKKTPFATILISISVSLFLFTALVILLAYAMTKNDIAPSVYKTAYIIICGFISVFMSFLNTRPTKVNPIIMFIISFAVSILFAILPVIAVSGSQTGLTVLIIPIVCIAASFIGTAAGRKI